MQLFWLLGAGLQLDKLLESIIMVVLNLIIWSRLSKFASGVTSFK